jgi:hypothetical protein
MNVQEKLSELSMKIADNIRAHNQLINEFDAIEKEVKELQQQPVTTNWYDFTEEQIDHLGEIVNNFVDNLVKEHLGSTDVHLRENGIEVSVEVDLRQLVEDELPYSVKNDFKQYLNDEITEQREDEQQDC